MPQSATSTASVPIMDPPQFITGVQAGACSVCATCSACALCILCIPESTGLGLIGLDAMVGTIGIAC